MTDTPPPDRKNAVGRFNGGTIYMKAFPLVKLACAKACFLCKRINKIPDGKTRRG